MAKMVKDTKKVTHSITGQEGAWVKVVKPFSDPDNPKDESYLGMAFRVNDGKTVLDKEGRDITHILG